MNAELRESDLDALMARLANGDRSAFDPLFHALLPRAKRLAAARVDPSFAADVAQTTLLKVFARAADFVPGRPCLPWFYAIAANELRAVTRRQARFEPCGELPDIASTETAESLYLERELERALEVAIASLDDNASVAIRSLLGRTDAPAIAPATMRKRISRAYARLRALLGAHNV